MSCRQCGYKKDWDEVGPSYQEIRGHGYFFQVLWLQWSVLAMGDDVLCKQFQSADTKAMRLQAVVPMSQWITVLQFWWKDVCASLCMENSWSDQIRVLLARTSLTREHIQQAVGNAQRKNPQKTKRALMQIVESSIKMDRITTFILGELPITEAVNKYIFVVSNYFTKCYGKYGDQYSSKNHSEKRFRVPPAIYSDHGW